MLARFAAVAAALFCACSDGAPEQPVPDAAPPVGPAPEARISEGPAEVTRATSATFVLASPAAGARFECSLDGAAFAACAPPVTVTVGEGEHRFAARARAAGGEPGAAAVLAWRVDLTAPETTIASGPEPQMAMSEATFTLSASESARFECWLDGAAPAVCEGEVRFAELALGPHALRARAVDAAANVDDSPALWEWTVVAVTPNTTITKRPDSPWRQDGVELEFISSVAGARFECRLNDGAAEPCVSPRHYDLHEGDWTFEVVAIDGDGRRDPTPARASFLIRYPFW